MLELGHPPEGAGLPALRLLLPVCWLLLSSVGVACSVLPWGALSAFTRRVWGLHIEVLGPLCGITPSPLPFYPLCPLPFCPSPPSPPPSCPLPHISYRVFSTDGDRECMAPPQPSPHHCPSQSQGHGPCAAPRALPPRRAHFAAAQRQPPRPHALGLHCPKPLHKPCTALPPARQPPPAQVPTARPQPPAAAAPGHQPRSPGDSDRRRGGPSRAAAATLQPQRLRQRQRPLRQRQRPVQPALPLNGRGRPRSRAAAPLQPQRLRQRLRQRQWPAQPALALGG